MDWRLHCGKAQDVLPGEYAGRVNLIVTSPPYDGLRRYGGYADAFDYDAVADALVPCLAPGGVLVWVVADAIVDGGETGTSFRQALGFMERGLRLHQTMIYRRWSINGMRANAYYREHENMWVFSNGKPAVANLLHDRPALHAGHTDWNKGDMGKSGPADASEGRGKKSVVPPFTRRGSVWNYVVGKPEGNRAGDLHFSVISDHPATFPYRLAADHIRSWSNAGDLVLDPMAGSGTTLRAAVNLGRRAVGVEVNPDYCDLIHRRMAQQVMPYDDATSAQPAAGGGG